MILDTTKEKDYDIACALRGPDFGNAFWLKWALTCRIRHLAGCEKNLDRGLVRTEPLSRFGAKDMLRVIRQQPMGLSHYLSHVGKAARALDDSRLAELARRLGYSWSSLTPEKVIELAGGGCPAAWTHEGASPR